MLHCLVVLHVFLGCPYAPIKPQKMHWLYSTADCSSLGSCGSSAAAAAASSSWRPSSTVLDGHSSFSSWSAPSAASSPGSSSSSGCSMMWPLVRRTGKPLTHWAMLGASTEHIRAVRSADAMACVQAPSLKLCMQTSCNQVPWCMQLHAISGAREGHCIEMNVALNALGPEQHIETTNLCQREGTGKSPELYPFCIVATLPRTALNDHRRAPMLFCIRMP